MADYKCRPKGGADSVQAMGETMYLTPAWERLMGRAKLFQQNAIDLQGAN